MVLDESMHKFLVLLSVYGGGKDGKGAIMELSMNNPGPTAVKGGRTALSIDVSMVRMTLDGAASPCGSW